MKKVASIFAMQTADAAYEPLRDRLLSHVNALSRQQRLIADYLLDHLQEVPFLSVPQLAERAGGVVLPMLFLGPDLSLQLGDTDYFGMDVYRFLIISS